MLGRMEQRTAADSTACLQVCHNLFQPNLGLHVDVPVDVAEAEGQLAISAQLRNAFACSGALQELLQVASRTVTAAAPGGRLVTAERLIHGTPTLMQHCCKSRLWRLSCRKGFCAYLCLGKRCPDSSLQNWQDFKVGSPAPAPAPAPLVTASATSYIRASATQRQCRPTFLCCCGNDSLWLKRQLPCRHLSMLALWLTSRVLCWAACSHTVACLLPIEVDFGSHLGDIHAMHTPQHTVIWPGCSSCRHAQYLVCVQSHWSVLTADECNDNNVTHLLGTVREMLHQLSTAALPLTEIVAPGEVAAKQKEETSMAQAGGAQQSPVVSGSAQGDAEMQVRCAYLRE